MSCTCTLHNILYIYYIPGNIFNNTAAAVVPVVHTYMTCTPVYTCVHIHVYVHTCATCTHTYMYIHTCMYVCMSCSIMYIPFMYTGVTCVHIHTYT